MRILVDQAGLHHQHKTFRPPGQEVQRDADLVGQVGLVGKFLNGATLEKFAIERTGSWRRGPTAP
jgi:hypothetical protein